MKIKTWLMISYFIVMLLPVVAIYILYTSLSNYDKKVDLKEYLDFQYVVNSLDNYLQDEILYEIQPVKNYEHLKDLVNEKIKIELFRPDGVMLFSTLDSLSGSRLFTMNHEILYKDLNEYKKNPTTYSVKRLVFDEDEEIVGIYEITMGRTAWVETSKQQTIVTSILLILFFTVLYTVVIMALNRKLNRPLQQLQEHMRAFAKGKELEKRLVQPKDEIGILISHFEQMKEEINETKNALNREQKEKEYMVASLSHDLKTPLTVIRTYTEALENHRLSEEERKEYQTILENKLDHMKQLIDDLSVFTALQSSDNFLDTVLVNGDEFFEMLFSGYEEPAVRKEVALHTALHVRASYKLDPKQMIRLMNNLMDNSLRYTPYQGNIWLGAMASNEELPGWVFQECKEDVNTWRRNGTVILIQNEGKGIKQSQLTKVFQPFYQDDVSRGKGATSGLGLSIAKMIIEKHKGKINIWSVENKGTLIACWLMEGNHNED